MEQLPGWYLLPAGWRPDLCPVGRLQQDEGGHKRPDGRLHDLPIERGRCSQSLRFARRALLFMHLIYELKQWSSTDGVSGPEDTLAAILTDAVVKIPS